MSTTDTTEPRTKPVVLVTTLLLAVAAWFGFRWRAAVAPAAYPYSGRALLELPRPLITSTRLLEILAPEPGERILEIGPGTGYYTLAVADRVGPAGAVEILDVRQTYLDHTMRRARGRGLENVVPTLGDGDSLPYADASFDAAYLVTVLGEIPDPRSALGELFRVLKPSGRLVVGETLIDPDYTSLGTLVRRAGIAGFALERRRGSPVGYYARFVKAAVA